MMADRIDILVICGRKIEMFYSECVIKGSFTSFRKNEQATHWDITKKSRPQTPLSKVFITVNVLARKFTVHSLHGYSF